MPTPGSGQPLQQFETKIQNWVQIDNQLKALNEEIKTLRGQRNTIEDDVIQFACKNNLNAATVTISDGRLRFVETKQYTPISLGFIEKCLNEVIANKTQAEAIMNYIKQKRETKVVPEIKRYYANNKASETTEDD